MKDTIGRELYSIKEVYQITYKAIFSVKSMFDARRHKLLSKQFSERVMLAVTEVNDCPACSYGHTKISLEAGMSNEEIKNMLSGVHNEVPSDQLPAVMFAQHYADYRGKPTEMAWNQVVEVYGKQRAEAILANVRMIMFGNAYGIARGSLINRFKGNPDERSNILYEMAMVLSTITFIPVAIAHVILANIVDTELINFK